MTRPLRILFQVAMRAEAEFLIETLALESAPALDRDLGAPVYRGRYRELDVTLVLHGRDPRHDVDQIGLEAAALLAYLGIRETEPDLMINFGTAGAFARRGARIGDVYLVRSPVLFHDRRVPLPRFLESQTGHHACRDWPELAQSCGFKRGTLSSGSSLEASARDLEILAEQSADVVDMEGAAIAWIAERKRVPCLFLKAVTDLIDRIDADVPVGQQFTENLQTASLALRDAVVATLDWVASHPDDVKRSTE